MAAPPPLCAHTPRALESARKALLGQAPQVPRRVLASVPRAHLRAYIPHKAQQRPPPGACWEMEFRPLGPHRLPGSGVRGPPLSLPSLEMVAGPASPRWLMGVVVPLLWARQNPEVGEERRQRHLPEVLRDWSFHFTPTQVGRGTAVHSGGCSPESEQASSALAELLYVITCRQDVMKTGTFKHCWSTINVFSHCSWIFIGTH